MESILYILLTSQLFMITNCYLYSGNCSMLITAVMFLFTLLIQLNFSQSVISPDNFPESQNFTPSKQILKEWKRMYSHPLIVRPASDPKYQPEKMKKRNSFDFKKQDINDEEEEGEEYPHGKGN